MRIEKLITYIQYAVFRHRAQVLAFFVLATAALLVAALQLRMDAAFTKNIPLNHPYMKTYMQHSKDFGGANSVMVAVRDRSGQIFNPEFFETLKAVHDQLFFIPGVDRAQVKSLFSPSTRYTEVVEDGFVGGPVIPADFQPTAAGLERVKANVEKAGIVGRLVSEDFSAAMVTAKLLDFDPKTGDKLDLLNFANELEQQIRAEYQTDQIDIHIIGFAKLIGDVADGAKSVVQFFGVAFLITGVLVFLFCRSVMLTILPLTCSFIAVVWQMGLLTVVGFGLDPMSILVPFLVFAIAVSHSVQMINSVVKLVEQGLSPKEAAESSFRRLLVPGGIALLSDTVGFLTILSIDIGIIRELAITASLGVAVIILTNLLLLPVLLSYVKVQPKPATEKAKALEHKLLSFATQLATPKVGLVVICAAIALYFFGAQKAEKMKIGDQHDGAPQLHQTSRYNQDTFLITDRFTVGVDVMSVMVETRAEACTYHEYLQDIDDFQWRIANVPGVQSVVSLASITKKVTEGFNEGNAKWHVLPNNTPTLVQSVGRVPTSSGMLNPDCSVMPVYIFMDDHKAETIEVVVDAVKEIRQEFEKDDLKFALASGPVGVMAATNEAVSAAQLPMLIYVYGAVILLCLISFRSVRATITVVLPLYVVSTLAQALMTYLEIGLTVATLPVIALGVGIGVDYGIYILSTMTECLNRGIPLREAYFAALKERGTAVLFTGVTLAIGVSTWFFSALKFQVDMGILLTFMFLVNMLGAVILLPAIATVFWREKPGEQETSKV